MKPHRIRMTHNLLTQYGLYRKMEVHVFLPLFFFKYLLQRPIPATFEEMTKFHSDDYITFLKNIRQDNISEYTKQMQRFNVGEVNECFYVYPMIFRTAQFLMAYLNFANFLAEDLFVSSG